MNKKDIKVIFMGTPKIASTILEGIIEDGYNVVLVVTNPDKKVGRKGILTPSEVKMVALNNNIEVFQPVSIKQDNQRISEVDADILITCAYGQIVPQCVLDAPKHGCINVHGSLLPHLRGASPIQSALFEGLKETGVTIMEMIDKMDAGRMFYKEVVEILDEDNYTTLYDKISQAGKNALLKSLPGILLKENLGEKQNEEEVTFCKKISPEDEHLSLEASNNDFINKVRGLSLTPGGFLLLDNKKLKIYKCKDYSSKVEVEVGKFIKKDKSTLLLQLKHGQVEILSLQKEGKNIIDAKAFMNGERNLLDLKVY